MAQMNMMLIGIAAVVVIVIVVGGFLLLSKPSAPAYNPTTTGTSSSNTGSSSNTSSSSSTSSGSSTANTADLRTYHGTYDYHIPLGPFGITDINNTIYEYNSIQNVSGSFSFTMNYSKPLDEGNGTGSGSASITTSGYCVGSNSTRYSFPISAVVYTGTNTNLDNNMTIIFETASPENSTVSLSCTNQTTGKHYDLVGNYSFLSVYPNIIQANQSGETFNVTLPGRINYTIAIH